MAAMCTSAQTPGPHTCHNRSGAIATTYTLVTIGVLLILVIVGAFLRPLVSSDGEGRMSEQWLAEHRAAHPS